MLHLKRARSSFFFFFFNFNFIIFFFVREVFFVFWYFVYTQVVFFFCLLFVVWSIPEQNYKYKHIHHYDYLLQLPSTAGQQNADTIECHRQADAEIHSQTLTHTNNPENRRATTSKTTKLVLVLSTTTTTTNYYFLTR